MDLTAFDNYDPNSAVALFMRSCLGLGPVPDLPEYSIWGNRLPSSLPVPILEPKRTVTPKAKTSKRAKRPRIRNSAERQWLEACWEADRQAAAARKALKRSQAAVP